MVPEFQGNSGGGSWFKSIRSHDALELIRLNPRAYALAAIIAQRAWYSTGFNADGCTLGEAQIGDCQQCGMSRQEYRTALVQLCKWQFISTRPTSKGTIAKLTDTRLFEIIPLDRNQQSNQRPTNDQPAANRQPTTNIERDNDKTVEKKECFAQVKSRFQRPVIEAIKLQCAKIGLADAEADKFFNYYESNGWRVGRNPMKSWTHALTNWKNNLQTYGHNNNRNAEKRINRAIGTANEGTASQYRGLGRVVKPENP